MRDYKNQTSRPPSEEPRKPPLRRPVVPEPEEETFAAEQENIAGEAKTRRWPWLLLIIVLLMSVGIWWWIAHLPISTGKLGLLPNPASAAKSTATLSAAPKATDNAVPPTTPNASAAPLAVATAVATTSQNPSSTVATASTASTHSGVDFNFYRILPSMHVDIPADILGSGPGIPTAATNSVSSLVNQPVTIQVGAFTNRAAAVVLHDRLALLGVNTTMEKVQGSDSNTLYRLRTRTFDSLAAAQPSLAKIRGMGITPLLIGSGIIGSDANAPLSQSPEP
ncbi:MAG: SPOR domain-containing protein [Acidithiobacillus sp.]